MSFLPLSARKRNSTWLHTCPQISQLAADTTNQAQSLARLLRNVTTSKTKIMSRKRANTAWCHKYLLEFEYSIGLSSLGFAFAFRDFLSSAVLVLLPIFGELQRQRQSLGHRFVPCWCIWKTVGMPNRLGQTSTVKRNRRIDHIRTTLWLSAPRAVVAPSTCVMSNLSIRVLQRIHSRMSKVACNKHIN